jgi:Domain of unknown function (DUF4301)
MEKNLESKDLNYIKDEFTICDLTQIQSRGIDLNKVKNQIEQLKNGIPKTILNRPATITDGIISLSEEEVKIFAHLFNEYKNDLKIVKFVPASGAATRMFGFLNDFLLHFNPIKETIDLYVEKTKNEALAEFLKNIKKFPFYKIVNEKLRQEIPNLIKEEEDFYHYNFINYLLSKKYFDYSNKPKGILPFHVAEDQISTPTEEHLVESIHYCDSNNNAFLHFTVSENHLNEFEEIIRKKKPLVEEKNKVQVNVTFSFQNKSTDTIALDKNNNVFRDEEDKLLFRQGGHGALITNLNALNCDLVFIKNIDNVCQNLQETNLLYKKALAGKLIDLRNKTYKYLELIENKTIDPLDLSKIIAFAKNELNIVFDKNFDNFDSSKKKALLFVALNKPMRICGMVKNEGEPGGGPFWVEDENKNQSLQIVESTQIEINNPDQNAILNASTHFNSVDIVCSIKDYEGEKMNLHHFVDEKSGFIVHKSYNGKALKGLELPGLWNGGMAKWITVFVEVPSFTFNPVKTVNDLLKPAHQ